MTETELVRERIAGTIESNRVVLFMKGTPQAPRCGFSAQVCSILGDLGVGFQSLDVLSDPVLREEIKAYSNWPTIPQLYVDGQFVGGCDIVTELYESGELNRLLGVDAGERPNPKVTITDSAARAFAAARPEGSERLRLEISSGYEYDLLVDTPRPGDLEVTDNGITLYVSLAEAKRADGLVIDFVEGPSGAGFKLESPHEPPKVRPISAKELQERLAKEPELALFDVRTDAERAIASIANARTLDAQGEAYLRALDKDRPIVIYCHHGTRSRSFAQQLVNAGYRSVFNLEGGIDAWSTEVDPSVPRY
jgi:monothiol glutaredoxin